MSSGWQIAVAEMAWFAETNSLCDVICLRSKVANQSDADIPDVPQTAYTSHKRLASIRPIVLISSLQQC